jgi:hypothetical protein
MMTDFAIYETARLSAQLGELVYLPLFLQPSRKRFAHCTENPIEALKLFLYFYAFERKVSVLKYKELAVRALEELSSGGEASLGSAGFSKKLWEKFLELGHFPADGKGANRNLNPLWPRQGEHQTSKVDVAARCATLDGFNLYRFACESLKSDRLSNAHANLSQIGGVASKIASLFLRDAALDQNLSDRGLRDRWLLQPIDGWLRRIAQQLLARNDLETDEKKAKALVELADRAGCCALRLNAGAWYFGSRVARTTQDLDDALKSPDDFRRCIKQHRERLSDEAERLSAIS